MIIGVPKEVKDHETRVGLVPSGATALREAGHEVLVESHAGEGSSITDREYMQAGAHILESNAEVWTKADLVVKVKEPQPAEYAYFRPGLILFTYLHLAPMPELTDRLLAARVSLFHPHKSAPADSMSRQPRQQQEGSNRLDFRR